MLHALEVGPNTNFCFLQSLQCATCNEPPEAHFYYYAHHNKQLTIQVKRLPKERELPGQAVGKLWMWSRCGKCKSLNGNSKSTKRVLISTAARGLSFGKFLELSFSNHSSFSRLSSCGHSLQRDFLYFFGYNPLSHTFIEGCMCCPPYVLVLFGLKGEHFNLNYSGVSTVCLRV